MKKKIQDIRFGWLDVKSMTDDEIVEIIEYCLPSDVLALIFGEIARRRGVRLEKLSHKPSDDQDNARDILGSNIDGRFGGGE